MDSIWILYGIHMYMDFIYGFYMKFIWILYGFYMNYICIWILYMDFIYGLYIYMDFMKFIWILYGFYMIIYIHGVYVWISYDLAIEKWVN